MGYTFSKKKPYIIKKSTPASIALRRLRGFLDEKEPQLVYWLYHTWNTQSRALTYKELREAILSGELSPEVLEEWQQDYSAFVVKHLHPMWVDAMETAAAEISRKHREWHFDPMGAGVREWTENRSAWFVTEVTSTQMQGMRAVIQRAAVLEDMGVDQLARAIRPMVGLTDRQSIANMRYYEKLIEKGASEIKARDLSARYAARQHRYRAYNIARTELAYSYNQGSYDGTKQAQEMGYMGDTVKVWSTADDERVCPICNALDQTKVGMDEPFSFRTRLTAAEPRVVMVPPAHPSCRCAVIYEEISPPINYASMDTT